MMKNKKMKQRYASYLLIFFLICTSCGLRERIDGSDTEETEAEIKSSYESNESSFPGQTAGLIEDPIFDTEEYLKEYDNNNYFSGAFKSIAENERTVYYINIFAGNRGRYLHYYDKESGISDILCARPECMHQDEDCGGYVGSTQPGLFLYDGKLYWIGLVSDPTGKSHFLNALIRCDLDGRNRETVLLIDREITLYDVPQEYYLHRGYLYYTGSIHTVNAAGEAAEKISIKALSIEKGGKPVTVFEEYCYAAVVARPKLFFRGTKLYYVYGYGDAGGGEKNYTACCYDMRSEETETLFRGAFSEEWKPYLSEYSFWMESGTIYQIFWNGEEGNGEECSVKKLEDGKWTETYRQRKAFDIGCGYVISFAKEEAGAVGEGNSLVLTVRGLEGSLKYQGKLQASMNGEYISIAVPGGNEEGLYISIGEAAGSGGMQVHLYKADIKNQTPPKMIIE